MCISLNLDIKIWMMRGRLTNTRENIFPLFCSSQLIPFLKYHHNFHHKSWVEKTNFYLRNRRESERLGGIHDNYKSIYSSGVMSAISIAHLGEDKINIPEYWPEMLVNKDFNKDTEEEARIVDVLKLRVSGAGGLEDEGVEHGPDEAEEGAVAEVEVPDLTNRRQTQETKRDLLPEESCDQTVFQVVSGLHPFFLFQ